MMASTSLFFAVGCALLLISVLFIVRRREKTAPNDADTPRSDVNNTPKKKKKPRQTDDALKFFTAKEEAVLRPDEPRARVVAFLRGTAAGAAFVDDADRSDSVRWVKLKRGDVACRAGEEADSVLIVARGELALSVPDASMTSVRVGALDPGDAIGHVSALVGGSSEKRLETAVVTSDDAVLAVLDKDACASLSPRARLNHCRDALKRAARVALLLDDEATGGAIRREDDTSRCSPIVNNGREDSAFASLPDCAVAALLSSPNTTLDHVAPGEVLFEAGDAAPCAFVVLDGSVREGAVDKGKGAVVGGFSFACGERRRHRCAANNHSTGARLIRLDDATFSFRDDDADDDATGGNPTTGKGRSAREEALCSVLSAVYDEIRPVVERWERFGLRRRFVPSGAVLPSRDVAYLIVSGRLRAFAFAAGKCVGARDATRGDVVGATDLIVAEEESHDNHSGQRQLRVVAARDAEVVAVGREALQRLLPPACALALVRRQLSAKRDEAKAVPIATDAKRTEKRTLGDAKATVVCLVPSSEAHSFLEARRLAHALASDRDGLEGCCVSPKLGRAADRDGGRVAVLLGDDAREAFPDELSTDKETSMCGSSLAAIRAKIATTWLADADRGHARVVLVADPKATPWTRVAVNAADVVAIVASAPGDAAAAVGDAERELLEVEHENGPPQVLVVCHPEHVAAPERTRDRLEAGSRPTRLSEPRVLHVRRREPTPPQESDASFLAGDVRRLSRFLTGRARGLVLSGGGARGLAHLGALKALRAADVEIDAVGGCSQGAMVALLVAAETGWPGAGLASLSGPAAAAKRGEGDRRSDDDHREAFRAEEEEGVALSNTTARLRSFSRTLASASAALMDVNWLFPFAVSTFSGAGFARAVARALAPFGNAHETDDDCFDGTSASSMADAWIPRYCVSTDATVADVRLHGAGDAAAESCLASMSLHGYFPPVVAEDGHLLVDGGYAANLPAHEMRAVVGARGAVLAVDVDASSSGGESSEHSTTHKQRCFEEEEKRPPSREEEEQQRGDRSAVSDQATTTTTTSARQSRRTTDWRRGLSGLRALWLRWRDPSNAIRAADVTSQLLYIRNYAQLRDAKRDGAFDACFRLESVARFGFADYGDADAIARAAFLETTTVLRSRYNFLSALRGGVDTTQTHADDVDVDLLKAPPSSPPPPSSQEPLHHLKPLLVQKKKSNEPPPRKKKLPVHVVVGGRLREPRAKGRAALRRFCSFPASARQTRQHLRTHAGRLVGLVDALVPPAADKSGDKFCCQEVSPAALSKRHSQQQPSTAATNTKEATTPGALLLRAHLANKPTRLATVSECGGDDDDLEEGAFFEEEGESSLGCGGPLRW